MSCCRVRRSSRSWATSTTARPRCSTTSVARRWRRAKPAALRSTSALITSKPPRASSRSSIRRATRRSRPCVRAVRRSPISWCWWWRPTTASCRRRSKPSSTRRAAEVPIVVAITKIDKPDADIDRVKNDLVKHNVIPEDWGGDTHVRECVGTHRRRHRSVARYHPAAGGRARTEGAASIGLAAGVVIESSHRKGPRRRWPPCWSSAVRLKPGDPIIAGQEFGRVRALFDETGKSGRVGRSIVAGRRAGSVRRTECRR